MPLYWLVRSSLLFPKDVVAVPPVWIPGPGTFTLSNFYIGILGLPAIGPSGAVIGPTASAQTVQAGFRNSLIIAVAVTTITVLVASPVGYAFGRLRFRFRNSFLFLLLSSNAIPPVVVAIPYYFLYQEYGLLGSYAGLIAVYLTLTIPLGTWVLLGYFATFPRELEQAARLDGLGRLGSLIRIVFPIAAPGIVAVGLISFLTSWNEFFLAYILVNGLTAQTFPVALGGFESAAIVIGLIPPFIITLALQRYITQLRIVDPVSIQVK